MAAFCKVDDPSAFFKVQLYTGNGSANHAITFDDTDTDMQPDLVWIKNRDAADSHCVFDSVRGATKVLHPDVTDAETTDTDTLDSFTSDGFQVDADVKVNTNAEDYAAYCWKESTDAGLDILIYTGTGSAHTISHNLSAVPHLMIHKGRTDAYSWITYHHKNTDAPETDHLTIESTAATADSAYEWNDTSPTSSVWTVGSGSGSNQDTKLYVAYLWSEKLGYSRFGTYQGSANADGPYIYTMFKPKVIIIKESGASGGNWQMFDTAKEPGNEVEKRTQPSEEVADSDGVPIDINSNGFKIRTAANSINREDTDFVYIAFAEAPMVNSKGIPGNAR